MRTCVQRQPCSALKADAQSPHNFQRNAKAASGERVMHNTTVIGAAGIAPAVTLLKKSGTDSGVQDQPRRKRVGAQASARKRTPLENVLLARQPQRLMRDQAQRQMHYS